MHAIEGTLEDLFGIPRSPKPTVTRPRVPSKPGSTKWLEPKLPLLVKGRVASIPMAARSRAPTCFNSFTIRKR